MFNTKLKNLRSYRGFTVSDLSDRSGVAESSIRKFENGELKPRIKDVIRLAGALEVATYRLL